MNKSEFHRNFISERNERLSQNKIKSPEIEEIIPPLNQAVNELKQKFQNEEFSLLIGDDDSGHIPTLIISGVINHINHTKNQPVIPVIFLKSHTNDLPATSREILTNKLKELNEYQKNKKVLIITEFMQYGNHLKNIGTIIHNLGSSYDIISCAVYFSRKYYKNQGVIINNEQIYPTIGALDKTPKIYSQKRTKIAKNSETHYYDQKGILDDKIDIAVAIKKIIIENNL